MDDVLLRGLMMVQMLLVYICLIDAVKVVLLLMAVDVVFILLV